MNKENQNLFDIVKNKVSATNNYINNPLLLMKEKIVKIKNKLY